MSGYNNKFSSIFGSVSDSIPMTFLLDDFSDGKHAYSMHQLASSATVSMRVRRDSDNATLDVGFVLGKLDTASLLTFVGANNGYITIMYDQAGSNDLIQTTAGFQRTIVNSGSLLVYSATTLPLSDNRSNQGFFNFTTPFALNSEFCEVLV